jgi:hypothetical protein
MTVRLASVFPRPSASDADDVVWTLQTAAVQWQRGLRADAIVWVRKAADISTQTGQVERAEELRNHAARLAEFLWIDPDESGEGTSPRALEPPPVQHRGSRQEESDEVIEIEELESYDLDEFSETELMTPDDAVADIAAEDLTYYQNDATSEPPRVLPDDLDLRSDSERPEAAAERDSFLSVNPEPENDDAYVSVSPEADSYLDVSSDVEGHTSSVPSSSFAPPTVSDQPTRPRIERPPGVAWRARDDEEAEAVRLPTLPSPPVSSPPVSSPPRRRPIDIPRAAAVPTVPSASEPARGPYAFSIPEVSPPETSPPGSPDVGSVPPEAAPEAEPPSIDGLEFEAVEALADLPEEAQVELAASGTLVTLTSDQELVLSEGAALVTRGSVHVTLTFSDVSAARVAAGAVVAARGSIESGPLRLIADAAETHVVTWTEEQLTSAMRDCPWVVDDLRLLADRFQAHASAGLGPLGERLDDALRAAVYERLQVRVLSPEESVAERGKPLKGLFVVAVGELSVSSGDTEQRLGAGEFLFPSCVIGAEPAPHDVKAGPKGGLVLFATRPVAHELMMSVPPLLEILAS